MYTAVIVDDELNCRENLTFLLEENCPVLEIAGNAGSVSEAVRLVQEIKPDVLFLDIEIGEGSGFDVIRQMTDHRPEVVFTTAYSDYAIKAFKFSAVDYLLKPIDIDELVHAVARVKDRLDNKRKAVNLDTLFSNYFNREKKAKRIGLSVQNGVHYYSMGEIIRLQSNSNYTTFFLTGNRSVVVSKTMKEYEELLAEQGFVRLHQSHIINMEHLVQYVKSDGGYVILSDQSTVPISKNYKDLFISQLNRF